MSRRSYYERKRATLDRCPECRAQAVMAQVTWEGTERTRYHAICSRKECALHRIPYFEKCHETELEAAAAWNGEGDGR